MDLSHIVLLVVAGVAAGIVNAIAGGGSLITFPTLIAIGLPTVDANVTNSVSVFPGYVSSVVGSRADLASNPGDQGPASPQPGSSDGPAQRPKKSAAAPAVPEESAASRASAAAAAAATAAGVTASSFLIDPATRARTALTVPAWRPTVDPLGRWVIYWQGTIAEIGRAHV